MRLCPLIMASFAALLLFSGHCLAHRVNVFAFVDGDAIRVEGGFAGGKKVNNGTVVAADAETGAVVFEGTTDARGECSFRPSNEFLQTGHGLKITLLAGEGHRDDWTMTPEELRALSPAASDPGDGSKAAAGPEGEAAAEAPLRAIAFSETRQQARSNGNDHTELEAMIGRVVDEKLLPVKQALARSMEDGPTLRDVVGGIGWMLGLLGLATYMKYRGRKRNDDGI